LNGSNIFFNGQLDDVKVYNYAISQKQIIQDMNGGASTISGGGGGFGGGGSSGGW